MAKGTTGFYLEGWKFSVYLAVPLFASWYFGDPQRQREAANYWQFVKYPANPNTGLKEQIEAIERCVLLSSMHDAVLIPYLVNLSS